MNKAFNELYNQWMISNRILENIIDAWDRQNKYLKSWGYKPENKDNWINGELRTPIKEAKKYINGDNNENNN